MGKALFLMPQDGGGNRKVGCVIKTRSSVKYNVDFVFGVTIF